MPRERKAFTLIELLVVVSIICLLVAILLPSFSRAKQLVRRAVCSNNMHQIGLGFVTWANGHQGNLPKGCYQLDYAPGAGNLSWGSVWYLWINQGPVIRDQTMGYYRWHGVLGRDDLVTGEVFYCPSWTSNRWQCGTVLPGITSDSGWIPESQIMPGQFRIQAHYWNRASFGPVSKYPRLRPASTHVDPPGVAIMTDNLRSYSGQHEEGTPVLYLGGHVTFYSDPNSQVCTALTYPAPPGLYSDFELACSTFFDQ